jgi:N-acetylmuramoyl-L-alanine amidase
MLLGSGANLLPSMVNSNSKKIMKICIDAGHGMSNTTKGLYDSGAEYVDNGVTLEEATISLQYAFSLQEAFHSRNVEVYLTRGSSTDHAPLAARATMAKSEACDLLISLHLNQFDDPNAHGLEILYGDNDSKSLAEVLLKELIIVSGFSSHGTQLRSKLSILKFHGPAVLVELGFISNIGDRSIILDEHKRDAIANKIADVVLKSQM